VNIAIDNLMKSRRVRFYEVRSDGKMLISLLRGWRVLSNENKGGPRLLAARLCVSRNSDWRKEQQCTV
jgi:hypothetical protein